MINLVSSPGLFAAHDNRPKPELDFAPLCETVADTFDAAIEKYGRDFHIVSIASQDSAWVNEYRSWSFIALHR